MRHNMGFSKSKMAIVSLLVCGVALNASATGVGSGMPWDEPIDLLVAAVTNKWAFGAAVLAFFGALAGLLMRQELGEVAKKLLMLVIVVSAMFGIVPMLTVFFGVTGATI